MGAARSRFAGPAVLPDPSGDHDRPAQAATLLNAPGATPLHALAGRPRAEAILDVPTPAEGDLQGRLARRTQTPAEHPFEPVPRRCPALLSERGMPRFERSTWTARRPCSIASSPPKRHTKAKDRATRIVARIPSIAAAEPTSIPSSLPTRRSSSKSRRPADGPTAFRPFLSRAAGCSRRRHLPLDQRRLAAQDGADGLSCPAEIDARLQILSAQPDRAGGPAACERLPLPRRRRRAPPPNPTALFRRGNGAEA